MLAGYYHSPTVGRILYRAKRIPSALCRSHLYTALTGRPPVSSYAPVYHLGTRGETAHSSS